MRDNFFELPEHDNADINIYTADSRDINIHANLIAAYLSSVENLVTPVPPLTSEEAALSIVKDFIAIMEEAKENIIYWREENEEVNNPDELAVLAELEILRVISVDSRLSGWKSLVEFMRARLIARHYIQDPDIASNSWWIESNLDIGDVAQSLDKDIYQFCTNLLPIMAWESDADPHTHQHLIKVYQSWLRIMQLYLKLQGKQMPSQWKYIITPES
jgi:hypothetical protein